MWAFVGAVKSLELARPQEGMSADVLDSFIYL